MTAYQALIAAMARADPACKGDSRFVDDFTSAETLRPICDSCPILPECRSARDAATRGAFWGIIAGEERRVGKQLRTRSVRQAI